MLLLERSAARRIRIRGLVQGVGLRPSVHRLATALNLNGWVCNDEEGVLIHVEGPRSDVDAFLDRLPCAIPSAAIVDAIAATPVPCERVGGFRICIQATDATPSLAARIPVDRATCADCQADVLDSAGRRFRHPFASCTSCGPRYSIVRQMPYERRHTSMTAFCMCPECSEEYENADDRRFHAEPIACPKCGPRLAGGDDWQDISKAAEMLRAGQIIALKGLGGYQLLVRADDNDAVLRLRKRKHRPSKPFAVMVRSLEEAERVAHLSPREREFLVGAANPIVLVRTRNKLAVAVAPGIEQIGIFLPTTPLHVLLLSQCDFPLVATSGNRSDEPIAIDETGRNSLMSIADGFLDHDRPIVRGIDDSVIRIIDERPMMIRLARGFAPCAIPALEQWAGSSRSSIPPILALGGQQKTALALWTGAQAILAQHLGDMTCPDARRAFGDATVDFARLYRCEPSIHVGDLHPDYFTTRWAQSAAKPFLQVQHHHAHAVACMVEHSLMNRDVLAVIFDGTGFGTDGSIWGGEILHASMSQFQRVGALEPFALPGGEAAIREPKRIALALLAATFGSNAIPPWLLDRIAMKEEQGRVLLRMMDRRIHTPQTSSVGRLFDGVAALLLKATEVSYEGEAALLLENAVDPREQSAYPIHVSIDTSEVNRGDWRPMIRCLVEDISNNVSVGVMAARFHNAIACWSAVIAALSPHVDVVLGGGCFQNSHLTTRTRAAIEQMGKNVHVPSRIPANDGGLAVGQLAIAMALYRQQTENSSCVSASPASLSSDAL